MTQLQKIIELCADKQYHCQREFWNLFIRSPHKRRKEITAQGKYRFEPRECIHGTKNSFDYRMVEVEPVVYQYPPKPPRQLELSTID